MVKVNQHCQIGQGDSCHRNMISKFPEQQRMKKKTKNQERDMKSKPSTKRFSR